MTLLASIAAGGSAALAQQQQQPAQRQRPQQEPPTPQRGNFGYEDVIKRARELSESPFDSVVPPLPPQLENQDWTPGGNPLPSRQVPCWLPPGPGRFRLQLFHLGHLFKKPVTITRSATASPRPSLSGGAVRLWQDEVRQAAAGQPGLCGFRIHYPLNDPRNNDELVSFRRSSYFRHLGKGSNTASPRAASPSTQHRSMAARNFPSSANSGSTRRQRRAHHDLRPARWPPR